VDAAVAGSAEAPPDPPSVPFSGDVVAALAELSPEQRAVVVLRFVFDYTPGEIARALEMPRGTVNSRLRRALDRLGEVIER
jgi:RNA polymerase sigma-70 factor (ECF subfamily)